MKMATVPDLGYVPTVPHLLARAVAEFGDSEFLVGPDRRYTFAEAEQTSAELALGLLAAGLGKGSKVAIMMPNSADWVIAWLAAARIGAHTIALSTFYRGRELSWALRFNDVDTVLMSDGYLRNDYVDMLETAVPGVAGATAPLFVPTHPYLRRVVVWGERQRSWTTRPADVVALGRDHPVLDRAYLAEVEANIVPADTLFTILTSGSSAEPKAVVHTHGVALRATAVYLDYLDFHRTDRTYTGQPFFWIGGLNINLFPSLHTGACLVFTETPRPDDILDAVEKEHVTRLSLWAAQIAGLKEEAARQGRDLSSVRTGLNRRRDEFGDELPLDRLLCSGGGIGLGMTESFGMHSMEKATNIAPIGKGGNWGRHLPGMQRLVVDPATGLPVPNGTEGELYIRGHQLMTGYYKREREEVFSADGFFPTGDLVVIDDDDYLFFTGRVTEMIKTSGANVAPREVELMAQAYADVREAIVFGMPDPVKGEIVVMVAVPADPGAVDGRGVDTADLRRRLHEDISPYKVPAEVIVMPFEDVPRTGSAKAHKPNLRRMAAELLGRPAE